MTHVPLVRVPGLARPPSAQTPAALSRYASDLFRTLYTTLVRIADSVNALQGQGHTVPTPLTNYAVADLPTAADTGDLAFCTDETGGAVPVFFDGAGSWRRVTDRAVAS